MLSRREKQDFEKGLVRVHYFWGLWTLGYHCSFLVTVFIDGIGQVHEISNKDINNSGLSAYHTVHSDRPYYILYTSKAHLLPLLL